QPAPGRVPVGPDEQPIAPGITVFQHPPEYYGHPSCQESNQHGTREELAALPLDIEVLTYLCLQPCGLAPLFLATLVHLTQLLCNVRSSHARGSLDLGNTPLCRALHSLREHPCS